MARPSESETVEESEELQASSSGAERTREGPQEVRGLQDSSSRGRPEIQAQNEIGLDWISLFDGIGAVPQVFIYHLIGLSCGD